ncbi:snurportin-1-like [Daphnia pulex]|uniref:snurportin-1-like n=1 Tax=Daphnia pulex TaxID=6669 RepID=UPI001EE08C90|nr:snurportin-1-like [Daphnia pulex]
MDNLIGSLELSLNVSNELHSTISPHPRFSQFKKTSKTSQEVRRRRTLENQKQSRYDYYNHCRCLAESDFSVGDGNLSDSPDEMEWSPPKIKTPRAYQDQIMLSEWLDEVPVDFETNWLIMPCPVGKRCLVVASRGWTKVYSKSGFLITEFQSQLPGGFHKSSDSTILDCLWNDHKQCYFVLDVLSWSRVPLLGCEAEFRFYWVNGKFNEHPELGMKSKKNRYPFIPLPILPCIKENIEALLEDEKQSWQPLDGLLFYHKLGFYTPGVSPLVGWLKPFMIAEILKAKVPEFYMQKKPVSYVNIQQHLKKKSPKCEENSVEMSATD